MTVLDDVLKDNREFVENFQGIEMSHHAAKNLVILTCMDCRLIEFLEPALGLDRGDAKIVRNAGNSISGEDAIRSIGAALYNLDANEVLVINSYINYRNMIFRYLKKADRKYYHCLLLL